jgi:hypothetical protein
LPSTEDGACGGLVVVTRSIEAAGRNAGGGGAGDKGHEFLGLSFNVELSAAERLQRDAVLLPFQVSTCMRARAAVCVGPAPHSPAALLCSRVSEACEDFCSPSCALTFDVYADGVECGLQRHLHSMEGPAQDRGKTTGDVEDDLEGVLQDEEEEEADCDDDDDDDDDPDDDLDI